MFFSFSWEEADVRLRGGRLRLLAVGSQWDLKLLQVDTEGAASVSLLHLQDCPTDRLLQTVREQDPSEYPRVCVCVCVINICNHRVCLSSGVCELQSLCVLSCVAGRCCVLMNCTWLLRWRWTQEELQMLSCCNIRRSDDISAAQQCVTMETLFVLSDSGLICILNQTAEHK